jgi:DNA-binding LytR/AlgR family response regulator
MTLRVMILEDEPPAAAQLVDALHAWDPAAEVVAVAQSVREAVAALRRSAEPDLVLADIRLADGLSFKVFEEVPLDCPVIFATAYDEHVITALEHNGIDYLLKPIQPARVAQALDKYARLRQHFGGRVLALARTLAGEPAPAPAPERLLARRGPSLIAIPITDAAWFTTEHKLTLLVQRDGTRLIVDESLGALETRLAPGQRFFRANRQFLVQVDAVASFRSAGKGRLLLTLRPPADDDVLVSQEAAPSFRAWIER